MIHTPGIVDKESVMQLLIQVGKVNGEFASGFELSLPENVDIKDVYSLIEHVGYVKQQLESTIDRGSLA